MHKKKIKYYLLQLHPRFFACFIFSFLLMIFYFNFDFLQTSASTQFLADDTTNELLINTSGCKIPAWNEWDESVKSLFEAKAPYQCPGQPSFLKVLKNGVVSLEDAVIQYYYEVDPQNVSCVYQEIIRDISVLDETVDSHVVFGQEQKLVFDQVLNCDFIKTRCEFLGRSESFEEFIPLTPLKTHVERRCVKRQNKKKLHKPLNVIFLGIDSISRLNYLRHFPKCRQYMKTLNPISLDGYTKVGDNTFPNIVPLLTGHFYQHYYDESKNKSMFFDDVDFSWKTFSDLGYRTLLAEDAPNIATFNYFRNGFKKPPTDYYFRPFAVAVEKSQLKEKSKAQCVGSKMEMQVVYDYLKSFVRTMGKNRPFFAFTFLARLTHDVLNYAGYADEPTYQLIKYLNDHEVLNNTMLVFFSDHGIRYGNIRKTRIGQYEERMPFMQMVFPKWFMDENKVILNNLIKNQLRLTTPFDIHATTLHFSNLMFRNPNPVPSEIPGISLFQEIPSTRTCLDAGISPHWCTCHVSKPISIEEPIVRNVAETVIAAINYQLDEFKAKCALLSLKYILDVRITSGYWGSANHTRIQNRRSELFFENFLIVLSAMPSNAIFESTVHCKLDHSDSCQVIDDISRINEYGRQSECISNTIAKKYCFCR